MTGPAFVGLVGAGVSHDASAALLREFFATRVVRQLVKELPTSELPLRASLVASQMFGLALTRYVLKLKPLAKAPVDDVVAAVAPTVQRYLTGTFAA